jgi:hypothetical protein
MVCTVPTVYKPTQRRIIMKINKNELARQKEYINNCLSSGTTPTWSEYLGGE